jgi:peptidylprolyl isomerase
MTSKRRRERRENRQRQSDSQQRNIWIVAGVVAVVVVAFIVVSVTGGNQSNGHLPRANRASAAGLDATAGTDPCAIFPPLTGAETAPPAMAIDIAKDYSAFIVTSHGTINVDLFANVAPETVNNFMFLACNGFYDGLTFHRVLPGFMAQGGDPAGDGSGGPMYTIPDEFALSTISFDKPGLLSMAHTSEPDSAGSQFFITYSVEQTQHLSGQFTIFGELADEASMQVALQLTPRDPDDPASVTITPDTMNQVVIRQMN